MKIMYIRDIKFNIFENKKYKDAKSPVCHLYVTFVDTLLRLYLILKNIINDIF